MSPQLSLIFIGPALAVLGVVAGDALGYRKTGFAMLFIGAIIASIGIIAVGHPLARAEAASRCVCR